MVRAYLISLLARQWIAKGAKIRDSYPESWLVWEPGTWTPAVHVQEEASGGTQLPPPRGSDLPQPGDALCFEMSSRTPRPWTFRLGRAPENDILVNDMTVSRSHLVLTSNAPEQWQVRLVDKKKSATSGKRGLSVDTDVEIKDGDSVAVGGVSLTFLKSSAFWDRVAKFAEKLTR